jgi:hypothetical protein
MTISERVYRLILKAYPVEYRREFGEPMLQLLRDQLRECAPGRWRVVLVWGRILADALRTVPAAYLEAPSSSEGGIMRHRTTLALICSVLFAWFGHQVMARAFWGIPNVHSFIKAHRPFEWPERLIYGIAAQTVADSLTVVFAVALFLLIMRKFSIGRFARGVLASVPVLAAGFAGLPFLFLLQPPRLVIYTAWFLPLLMSVVAGAWAANAWGQGREEVRTDLAPRIPA